jgi:Cu(I)/Ag(I) efflux system membrane fusion protein
MFVTVSFAPARKKDVLLVPTEAVIRTGTRTLVILAEADGRFRPAEVEAGVDAGGDTEIRKGLEAGQKVVRSGQFLIDSEASLRGVLARMDQPAPSAAAASYRTSGKVEALTEDEVTLSHDPVPQLKWPHMTMAFRLPPGRLPKDVKVGDDVQFEFRQGADGRFEISSIGKARR